MRALVLALAYGCVGQNSAMVVANARLDGHTLILTKCTVIAHGDELVMNSCHDENQPVPVIVTRSPRTNAPAAPPATSERDAATSGQAPVPSASTLKGVALIHHVLVSCGQRWDVTGRVTVRVDIDPAGNLMSITTDTGGRDLDNCLQTALSSATFPEPRGRLELPFVLR